MNQRKDENFMEDTKELLRKMRDKQLNYNYNKSRKSCNNNDDDNENKKCQLRRSASLPPSSIKSTAKIPLAFRRETKLRPPRSPVISPHSPVTSPRSMVGSPPTTSSTVVVAVAKDKEQHVLPPPTPNIGYFQIHEKENGGDCRQPTPPFTSKDSNMTSHIDASTKNQSTTFAIIKSETKILESHSPDKSLDQQSDINYQTRRSKVSFM